MNAPEIIASAGSALTAFATLCLMMDVAKNETRLDAVTAGSFVTAFGSLVTIMASGLTAHAIGLGAAAGFSPATVLPAAVVGGVAGLVAGARTKRRYDPMG